MEMSLQWCCIDILGFQTTTPWSRLIRNLPYPEKPVIAPAGQRLNNLTSPCCNISAHLTHLTGAVPHPSTCVKWQVPGLRWNGTNSSEMHVWGLVFQVMCVHGEEEGKWARAILYLCDLSSVKHLSQIYFVMGLHQRKARTEISGVFRVILSLLI